MRMPFIASMVIALTAATPGWGQDVYSVGANGRGLTHDPRLDGSRLADWCGTVGTARYNRLCQQVDVAPAPPANTYQGLAAIHARRLAQRNRQINDSYTVRVFNSLAPVVGVPNFEAGPMNANVETVEAFGHYPKAPPRQSGSRPGTGKRTGTTGRGATPVRTSPH